MIGSNSFPWFNKNYNPQEVLLHNHVKGLWWPLDSRTARHMNLDPWTPDGHVIQYNSIKVVFVTEQEAKLDQIKVRYKHTKPFELIISL